MSAVVIVGAGQAGFQAALSLREQNYDGTVTVVGEEPHIPYQRPPLSKAYLAGAADETTLLLRPAAFFADRDITVLTGERVTAIDRLGGRVALASGKVLPYDHLILATGARTRTLPGDGEALKGVLALRTLGDAALLKARLDHIRRAVVLGAGFIGLEFAAVAAKRGIAVTVVEMAERPMARVLSPTASAFFRTAHEGMGVTFAFNTRVTRLLGDQDGHVAGVETAGGAVLPADLVLVGIGVLPNAELAAAAGLPVSDGIEVDENLTTADPAISAIGDCAFHPSRFGGGMPLRIESVQNAIDQGRCIAKHIVGGGEPYAAVPWFWSDQGPYKLQIVGIASPGNTAVVRGDVAAGQFSVFCYAGEELRAVESVNRPQDHMAARRLMARGTGPTPAEAADPAFDLKAMAQRAG